MFLFITILVLLILFIVLLIVKKIREQKNYNQEAEDKRLSMAIKGVRKLLLGSIIIALLIFLGFCVLLYLNSNYQGLV